MLGQRTSITLHKETVERLGDLGHFNESYEDVVKRLISIAKKNKNGEG
jgi:predicted CopG family antitoxin